jgi:hypothetical protein
VVSFYFVHTQNTGKFSGSPRRLRMNARAASSES